MTDEIISDKFPLIPQNKTSRSNRKSIFGVGVNDSEYLTHPIVNGKQLVCPFYRKWYDMLRRVYCKKHLKRNPSYIGCSVCGEWLVFSSFREWMGGKDWENKQLDKDILLDGNKIYSPSTCAFVTPYTNTLFTDRAALRGSFPKGVSINKRDGKFVATVGRNGKREYLGIFNSQESAYSAYLLAKAALIESSSYGQSDPRVKCAMFEVSLKMREEANK